MSRAQVAVLVVVLLLAAVLAVVAFAKPVRSDTPRPILPLPQAAFTPVASSTAEPSRAAPVIIDDTQHVAAPSLPARPAVQNSGSVAAKKAPSPPVTAPVPHLTGRSISGQATWYAWRVGQAAAGPALRAALGSHWRGRTVRVCAGARCVTVRLTDWCACHPATRLVDLDTRSFAALGPTSAGILRVTVRW